MSQPDTWYTAQINGEYEGECQATDIFEATTKFLQIYKDWKGEYPEVSGTDLTIRVWNAYGEGF